MLPLSRKIDAPQRLHHGSDPMTNGQSREQKPRHSFGCQSYTLRYGPPSIGRNNSKVFVHQPPRFPPLSFVRTTLQQPLRDNERLAASSPPALAPVECSYQRPLLDAQPTLRPRKPRLLDSIRVLEFFAALSDA